MTITPEQIAEWQRLADAATEGPWETDATENEGAYGGGPDCRSGFSSYEVVAASGRVCDTLNSDVALVSEEYDEDGITAFDEVGKANMEFIVASRTAVPALIAEVVRFRNALTVIAAYTDKAASHRLETTNSYGGFDEPASVQMAREALEAKP